MNAIILAAGLGSRFKSITETTHKAMLPIDGIPNVERTIRYLKEAGVCDIYIVVGYLAEQFDYLKDKYNVKLLLNKEYTKYNSIFSFYQALPYFNNSFVIDSDVVLFENLFKHQPSTSTYYLVTRPQSEDKEWCVEYNGDKTVRSIRITNEPLPSLLGISYWNENDCAKIKSRYSNYLDASILRNPKLYWDNVPMEMLDKLNIKTIELDLKQAYEMDNLEQYQFITQNLQGEKDEIS